MATTHPLVAPGRPPGSAPPGPPNAKDGSEASSAQASAPAPVEIEEGGAIELSGPAALLPVELDVVVPVHEFRVRHLLALRPGQLIESQWSGSDDVPLASGKVQLAWSEFEVIDSQLVVRVTRLA